MGLRDDLRELDRRLPGLKILLKWCAFGIIAIAIVVGGVGFFFGEAAAVSCLSRNWNFPSRALA